MTDINQTTRCEPRGQDKNWRWYHVLERLGVMETEQAIALWQPERCEWDTFGSPRTAWESGWRYLRLARPGEKIAQPRLLVGDMITPMQLSDVERSFVQRLMARIWRDDALEDQGHCGDGSMERFQRQEDHQRRMAAISILRHYTGENAK